MHFAAVWGKIKTAFENEIILEDLEGIIYLFSMQLLGGLQRCLDMITYSDIFHKSKQTEGNVMILIHGCDACIPSPLTLQSGIAAATMKRSILSYATSPSTVAHPGEHPLPCLVQDKASFSLQDMPVSPFFLSSHIISKDQKDSGNALRNNLKRSLEEA